MKSPNFNKNRSILLAHDLITHQLSDYYQIPAQQTVPHLNNTENTIELKEVENLAYKATAHSDFNRLQFLENIEVVSNIDFKPYRGVSFSNEDGSSAKISSKLKLLLTFYLLKKIAGQLPFFIKAKKSVANFNLRAGMDVGVKLTLRNQAFERFYKNFNVIMLPVKGTKQFRTPNMEKDYAIRSLSFMQPLNGYIILQDAWFIYNTASLLGWGIKKNRTSAPSTVNEFINISNKVKLDQVNTGAHLRFNINPKLLNKSPEIKVFILNYFLIPS